MAIKINADGSADVPYGHYSSFKDEDALARVVVFGCGPVRAGIMLVGERPGKWEAIRETPFCGPAGKELDYYLAHAGLRRRDIYITNLVKTYRGYDKPTPEEIEEWLPFLHREIDTVQPRTIGLLGSYAVKGVMQAWWEHAALSERHGNPWRLPESQTVVVPMYHPASSLYSEDYRAKLEYDFERLKAAHEGRIEGGIRYINSELTVVTHEEDRQKRLFVDAVSMENKEYLPPD